VTERPARSRCPATGDAAVQDVERAGEDREPAGEEDPSAQNARRRRSRRAPPT
jgi:hypothetical protein